MNNPSSIRSMSSLLKKHPHWSATFGLALILGVLVFIASASLNAPFILDDIDQLYQTASQHSLSDAMKRDCYGLYRPVKTSVFFLLSRVFPDAPTLWRLTGLALYFASIFLFHSLAKRLFSGYWIALAATAIWALAPTQVSTYAWCSCINIQIMTLAVLSAMLLFDLHQSAQRSSTLSALFVSGIALLYALAFFSYESAIVLPALMLIWSASRGQKILARKSLVTMVACGMTGLMLLAIRHAMKGDLNIENSSIHGFTPLQLSWASGRIIWDHFSLWFWPFGRQAISGTLVNNGRSILTPYFILPWMAIAAISLGALLMRKRCPMIAHGLLFFFIAFFPMSNLIPFFNGPYADYYLIVPSIGLTIVLVSVLGALVSGLRSARQPWALILLLILIPLLRIGAVGSAFRWSKAWNDETLLYANTLKTFPEAYTAKANLARCLPIPADQAYAEQLALEAVEAAPWYTHGRFALIAIYLKTGNMEAAIKETETVLSQSPTQLYPWSVMGYLSEIHLGDRSAAIEAYGMAQNLSWQGESENATINHARLLSLKGKDDEALAVLQKAQERAPRARGINVVYAEFNRNPDLFRDSAK